MKGCSAMEKADLDRIANKLAEFARVSVVVRGVVVGDCVVLHAFTIHAGTMVDVHYKWAPSELRDSIRQQPARVWTGIQTDQAKLITANLEGWQKFHPNWCVGRACCLVGLDGHEVASSNLVFMLHYTAMIEAVTAAYTIRDATYRAMLGVMHKRLCGFLEGARQSWTNVGAL